MLQRLSCLSCLVVLLGAVGSGCASAPPARAAGPSQSGGLSVALVGQRCGRENDPSWSVADVLDLALQVQVTNHGDAPIRFDPAALQLVAAGDAHAPHRADASDALMPGETRVFAVAFLERDDRLACNVPMMLTLDGTTRVSNAPVPLAPIPFLASRKDI